MGSGKLLLSLQARASSNQGFRGSRLSEFTAFGIQGVRDRRGWGGVSKTGGNGCIRRGERDLVPASSHRGVGN